MTAPRNPAPAGEPEPVPSAPRITPVAVVEDNRLLREGIVAVLSRQADLDVVAVAGDAGDAMLRVPETRPRVVLLDASLGEHDGYHLVVQIKQAVPEARMIVMDLLPMAEDIVEFVRRGASGFVAKDATVDDFVRTIRSVAAGREVLPTAMTGSLFSHIARQALERPSPAVLRNARMTRRERQVIDLVAEGLSNNEMAHRLNLSTYTVKSHVHNILEKLALHTRLQLAAHAHQSALEAESA